MEQVPVGERLERRRRISSERHLLARGQYAEPGARTLKAILNAVIAAHAADVVRDRISPNRAGRVIERARRLCEELVSEVADRTLQHHDPAGTLREADDAGAVAGISAEGERARNGAGQIARRVSAILVEDRRAASDVESSARANGRATVSREYAGVQRVIVEWNAVQGARPIRDGRLPEDDAGVRIEAERVEFPLEA